MKTRDLLLALLHDCHPFLESVQTPVQQARYSEMGGAWGARKGQRSVTFRGFRGGYFGREPVMWMLPQEPCLP
ncbi:hypothetical protein ASA1KI_10390 [Opitutales bacterium ASA1]|uniref:hypothetical protein n=1 Tax=Congregicoccus parvus TaxID=3081749 RepID=UPI002B295B13|nr:hypothetical protein ASA1KI_10390 [Opitutales bacterium ASA1]